MKPHVNYSGGKNVRLRTKRKTSEASQCGQMFPKIPLRVVNTHGVYKLGGFTTGVGHTKAKPTQDEQL